MNKSFLFCLLLITPFAASAADSPPTLDYLAMTMGLLGGLALFLYGMEKMSEALKRAAGSRMKEVLAKLTKNRVSGVLTGAGLTAVIQSSSVTTVLLVGFVSAGLMTLNQTVGVIMGANIGTTMTGQIIAFKVTKAALAMVALGFVINMTGKREAVKNYGNILLGLGMLFLGMNMMSEAMTPLRAYQPFIDLMASMDNVLFAIIIAASFTALVQSSSATTGIVIVLASQGFITLETGIALAMGANIGTCITALLATIGKGSDAKRTSAIHLLFNVGGVIIWLPFIAILAHVSTLISPVYSELTGMERLAMESPRQIANANTIFNVLNTLIMLPFSHYFVDIVKRFIPSDPKPKEPQKIDVKYIKDDFLSTPDIALQQAHLEIARVGRRVVNMVNMLPSLGIRLSSEAEKQRLKQELKNIDIIEDEVDTLHFHILSYLGKLRKSPLSKSLSDQQIKLVSITDQLESIADLVVNDLVPLSHKAIEANFHASDEMHQTLDRTQERVSKALLDAVNATRRNDDKLAEGVIKAKREINALLDSVLAHQAERLSQGTPKRLSSFRAQMEWVEVLKRIYTLSKRIAKLQLRKNH